MSFGKLVDLDWKFGVTAANSEINKLGSLFLKLKLTLDNGKKEKDTAYMELTLDQFYHFLQEMEQAQHALDLISS